MVYRLSKYLFWRKKASSIYRRLCTVLRLNNLIDSNTIRTSRTFLNWKLLSLRALAPKFAIYQKSKSTASVAKIIIKARKFEHDAFMLEALKDLWTDRFNSFIANHSVVRNGVKKSSDFIVTKRLVSRFQNERVSKVKTIKVKFREHPFHCVQAFDFRLEGADLPDTQWKKTKSVSSTGCW